MAFTELDICNLALSHIKQTNQLSRFDRTNSMNTDNTKVGRACLQFYNLALDTILADFPWSIARRVIELTRLENETSDYYDYVYAYPEDCLEPRAIVVPNVPAGEYFYYYNSFFYGYARGPLQTSLPDDYRVVFEKGLTTNFEVADGPSRTIMTNQDEARLLYTARITNPALYTSSFIEGFSYKLAAYLANPIANSPKLGEAMAASYQQTISQAAAQDLRGDNSPHEPIPDTITARLY